MVAIAPPVEKKITNSGQTRKVLAATHAVATVMAQIAVAVSDCNRSAVIATRCIALETGKLFTARSSPCSATTHHGNARSFKRVGIDQGAGKACRGLELVGDRLAPISVHRCLRSSYR